MKPWDGGNFVLEALLSLLLNICQNHINYRSNLIRWLTRLYLIQIVMMNGYLLNAGFPPINLPASRQLEFNRLMITFYESGEMQPMNIFLRICLDERVVKIMLED